MNVEYSTIPFVHCQTRFKIMYAKSLWDETTVVLGYVILFTKANLFFIDVCKCSLKILFKSFKQFFISCIQCLN